MSLHLFSTLPSFNCILRLILKIITRHQEMLTMCLLHDWLYIKHIVSWGCRIHLQRWNFLLFQIHLRSLRLQLILRRRVENLLCDAFLRNHCVMIRIAVSLTKRCAKGRAIGGRDPARKAWRVWNQLNWLADRYIWETWLLVMLTWMLASVTTHIITNRAGLIIKGRGVIFILHFFFDNIKLILSDPLVVGLQSCCSCWLPQAVVIAI